MKKNEQITTYIFYALLIIGLLFFALPALGYPKEIDQFILVIFNVIACVLVSAVLGIAVGVSKISIIYPIMVGVLFFPTTFIFYTDAELIFVPIYIIVAVIAICIGWLINPKGII